MKELSLEVIQVDVLKLFKLVVDTGNPYLDAFIAVLLVAMLLGALVIYRRSGKPSRPPRKEKPPKKRR
jgi:hypothetical protein